MTADTARPAGQDDEAARTKVHVLRCWDRFWDAIERDEKTYELRRNDRGYKVGDLLVLVRVDGRAPHDPTDNPPRVLTRRVTYMTSGPGFGLAAGDVCMALGDPGYVCLGATIDRWLAAHGRTTEGTER